MNALVAPEPLPVALNTEKAALLARLAEGLAAEELYWAAAWIAAQAGLAQRGVRLADAAPSQAPGQPRLTILYGSQTGNAKRLAEQLAARGESAGMPVRLLRADAYPQRELAQETHLLIVISTQGDGEPPDDARGFVEFVTGKRAPKLAHLQFAVLGLGDSSYPQFCVIGRQLDARLAELGGARLAPLGEADVDIETIAQPWSAQALAQAREALQRVTPLARTATVHALPSRSVHSREQPFAARVLANQRIVSRDSAREVRHLELSLEGSHLRYAPGDALGVWPRNPPALVAQWLETLHLDGAQEVSDGQRALPLAQWLERERELTRLSRSFVAAHAAASGREELMRVLRAEHAASFAELLASHQPIDLLRRYRATWRAEDLIAALRPLTPRLYSIASSPRAVGEEEVHVTVATVEYEAFGAAHWGAASAFLSAAEEDATVPVFIESNERFRLPADDSRDIIMIGPGTGVAPFRAFLQERRESGARGRNWLLFGNRHFTRDFLYQVEWQEALRRGALHRLDLAFSRDTAQKVYVQDRLREQGRELYAWLQEGAHLYVCGDATHMAKDVQGALIDIAVAHGGHSPDAAKAWLADLLTQGRYARDVY